MLDEEEWAEVEALLREGTQATKAFRQRYGLPLEGLDLASRYEPALEAYAQLTGFRETNAEALWHHRAALYGPPCAVCGKPLRTPKARLCGSCGAVRSV